MPWKKILDEIEALPNIISLYRIFTCLVIIIPSIFRDNYGIAVFWYVIGSASDALDGRIARKYNLVTDTGKGLDPLADKILHIGTILSLLISAKTEFSLVFIFLLFSLCVLELELIRIGIQGIKFIGTGLIGGANNWGKVKASYEVLFTLALFAKYLSYDLGELMLCYVLLCAIGSAFMSIRTHKKTDFKMHKAA
ncbi:MAG: CDP-alcohol phosphatidyltransferase family protein [bacterium]|nr:CDP-alcohol phosphatidyltransferase family protein [bacterium]